MTRTVLTGFVALLALATAAPVAHAAYGPGADIASASLERLEQGDEDSTFGAISGDGRYVAFTSRARNLFADDDPDPAGQYRVGGLFRRDMQTGRVALIADGERRRRSDNALVLSAATQPSISRDGRYVAFTTPQRLVAADTNDFFDVYVRDMDKPLRAPDAYELVSAQNGSSVPATYDPPVTNDPAGNSGSDVWGGAAISAGGRRVAFRTARASSLPSAVGPTTPEGQVLVRDLDARTTRLMTRDQGDGTPAGGAIGPTGISADGSTIAWTGSNAPAQTRFLDGELQDAQGLFYLWRRVDAGPGAPTRRITGIADPDDASCPPGGAVSQVQTQTGSCFGPLTAPESARANLFNKLPALSADGDKVAFVVGAGPRPNDQTGPGLDVWVADMSAGVSRKAGSRELTREGVPGDPFASGQVDGVTLSADGRWLALATVRSRFVLPRPVPIGSFRRSPGSSEVYVIDLASDTVERASIPRGGGDADGDALSRISISGDGARIAFASAARNLFFGDANQRTDVFVANRTAVGAASGGGAAPEQGVFEEPPPFNLSVPPEPPALEVRARTRAKGVVQLIVDVPAAGNLDALARGDFEVKRGRRTTTKVRTVGSARREVAEAQRITLSIRPSRKILKLITKEKRVEGEARVRFRPAAQGVAGSDETVTVVYRVAAKKAAKKRVTRRRSR